MCITHSKSIDYTRAVLIAMDGDKLFSRQSVPMLLTNRKVFEAKALV
jgi:hypothetical protein